MPETRSTQTPPLFPCIMAGGSGERFWPLSRATTPKHLLKLFSDRTLLEETADRLTQLAPVSQIFVLTNAAQLSATRQALPFIPPEQIVAEPAKRDTAPAAALATALAYRHDPRAIVALLPADHVIGKTDVFCRNLRDAARAAAASEALVTLSIHPTWPCTAFGYLELGEDLAPGAEGTPLRKVRRFVEKPDEATASSYIESGHYAWNAGMFLWRADAFLAEAERSQPELATFIRDFPAGDFGAYLAERFPTLPKISVDYAIMEKARHVISARAEFPWDDVGSWTAVRDHIPADKAGNCVRGTVFALDAENNIVFSRDRPIALCGVKDLVVVDAGDALLICHKDQDQNVKKLLSTLPENLK